MALLKCVLFVFFCLSFSHAWRNPPPVPKSDKSPESEFVPPIHEDGQEVEFAKDNKVPSSGVGVGRGSGTGSSRGTGTGIGYGYGSGSEPGGGSGSGYGYGSGSGSGSGSGYGYGSGSGPGSGYGSGNGNGGSGTGVGIGVGQGGGNHGYPSYGCPTCPPYNAPPCQPWSNDPNCGNINIPPPPCVPYFGPGYGSSAGSTRHEDHHHTTEATETQGQAMDEKPMNETPDPSAEHKMPDKEAQVGSSDGPYPQVQF